MIPLGVLASGYVGGLPAADATFGFLGSIAASASTATTHTFTGQSLGDPCVGRTILVAVVTQASISDVTIGGQPVTLDANDPGTYSTRAVVGHVTLAAGTSADVVVTLGTAHNRVVVGLWRYGGAVTVVATDTASPIALAVQSGDHCIAAKYWVSGTYAWSGATSRFNVPFATGDYGAGADYTAASTTTTSITLSGIGFAMAGAAYRPA